MRLRTAAHAVALAGALLASACERAPSSNPQRSARAIPVEAAPIERRSLELRRVFNGTLEPLSEVVIVAKVPGRVERVEVALGDAAPEGASLVRLEDEGLRQAVSMARADVTVAEAKLLQTSATERRLMREAERVEALHGKGLTSDTLLEAARAEAQAAHAEHKMALGTLERARASLAAARIQLGYATVRAGPLEGGKTRVVAQRHVDPGDTVAVNAPLLTLMVVDPLLASISVTEYDYPRIGVGQEARLWTDSLPGLYFDAQVARVAPAFDEASRQARLELRVDNPERKLAPGLFARVELQLGRVEDAILVPEAALTRREDQAGVFVLGDANDQVRFVPVELGARSQGKVQIQGDGLSGRVVTVGQQLLDDGSEVRVTNDDQAVATQEGDQG